MQFYSSDNKQTNKKEHTNISFKKLCVVVVEKRCLRLCFVRVCYNKKKLIRDFSVELSVVSGKNYFH